MNDAFDEIEVLGGLLLVDQETGMVPAVVVPHVDWYAAIAFEYLRRGLQGDEESVDRPVLDGGTPEAAAREFYRWWSEQPDHDAARLQTVQQATAFIEGWNAGISQMRAE